MKKISNYSKFLNWISKLDDHYHAAWRTYRKELRKNKRKKQNKKNKKQKKQTKKPANKKQPTANSYIFRRSFPYTRVLVENSFQPSGHTLKLDLLFMPLSFLQERSISNKALQRSFA